MTLTDALIVSNAQARRQMRPVVFLAAFAIPAAPGSNRSAVRLWQSGLWALPRPANTPGRRRERGGSEHHPTGRQAGWAPSKGGS